MVALANVSHAGKYSAVRPQYKQQQQDYLENQERQFELRQQMEEDLQRRYEEKKDLEKFLRGLQSQKQRNRVPLGVECEGLSLEQYLAQNCR